MWRSPLWRCVMSQDSADGEEHEREAREREAEHVPERSGHMRFLFEPSVGRSLASPKPTRRGRELSAARVYPSEPPRHALRRAAIGAGIVRRASCGRGRTGAGGHRPGCQRRAGSRDPASRPSRPCAPCRARPWQASRGSIARGPWVPSTRPTSGTPPLTLRVAGRPDAGDGAMALLSRAQGHRAGLRAPAGAGALGTARAGPGPAPLRSAPHCTCERAPHGAQRRRLPAGAAVAGRCRTRWRRSGSSSWRRWPTCCRTSCRRAGA